MELLSYEEAAGMSEAELLEWITAYRRWREREHRRAALKGFVYALSAGVVIIAAISVVLGMNGWIPW